LVAATPRWDRKGDITNIDCQSSVLTTIACQELPELALAASGTTLVQASSCDEEDLAQSRKGAKEDEESVRANHIRGGFADWRSIWDMTAQFRSGPVPIGCSGWIGCGGVLHEDATKVAKIAHAAGLQSTLPLCNL